MPWRNIKLLIVGACNFEGIMFSRSSMDKQPENKHMYRVGCGIGLAKHVVFCPSKQTLLMAMYF